MTSCSTPPRSRYTAPALILAAAGLIAAIAPAAIAAEDAQASALPAEISALPAEAEMPADISTPTEAVPDSPAGRADGADVRLRFNFRYQPWQVVLDWFAQQAGLSLVADRLPPGTFNYVDSNEYTPAQAIDVLNRVLMLKGYVLVRSGRMLVLVNLEDGIPPNLVSTVPLDELDDRGEFELVKVLFQLQKLSPEEAQKEAESLLGPQGSVVILPKSRQLLMTDTAGRLRTIRRVIQSIEDPQGLASGQLRIFEIEYVAPEEVLLVARQLLDIPPDKNATADGSLRVAVMAFGTRIMATGKPEMLARLAEIVKSVDSPDPSDPGASGVSQAVQLVVYPVRTADPELVVKVISTTLAGAPDLRLQLDTKTSSLVALARPKDHATIRAMLDEMESESQSIEVIQLRVLDPLVAVAAINKMFGLATVGAANGLTVDADPGSAQIVVRGSGGQIAQIRDLLVKLGEPSDAAQVASAGGNVRVLPLSGRTACATLEQLQQLWPTMRANKIRQVTPSNSSGSMAPNRFDQRPTAPDSELRRGPNQDSQPSAFWNGTSPRGVKALLVAQTDASDEASEAEQPPDDAQSPDIVVSVVPGGLVIASQDLEALDDFERLLETLSGGGASTSPGVTIFYLKHAAATPVAQTLNLILGGSAVVSSVPTGRGGRSSQNTAPATANLEGGMLAAMTGPGGSITPTGPIKITAETRLNALIVQANPADIDTVEDLLQILDQSDSPEEVLAVAKPRLIPVYNTQAEDIVEIVRQAYPDRLITGGSSGGNRPSPQEIMEAVRGGRSGGRDSRTGGSQNNNTPALPKMALGVDPLSNSVIVTAPDALFQEVKQLVATLDQGATESDETVQSVQLHQTNAQTIQQALSALVGDDVQFTSSSSRSGSRTSTASRSSSSQPSGSPAFNPGMFFRAMQQQGGFSGRGGSSDRGGSNGPQRSSSGRGSGGSSSGRGR